MKKICHWKFEICHSRANAGMTFLELIIILAIFSVLSSMVLFNYGNFQAKVDVTNLASDIALKVVEAQKAATSGKRVSGVGSGWKPAYGVYFQLSQNKKFIYFADLDSDKRFDGTDCTGECLGAIAIIKNNFISDLTAVGARGSLNDLAVSFERPDSSARFFSGNQELNNVQYVQIKVESPKGAASFIKLYPSGRIEVN